MNFQERLNLFSQLKVIYFYIQHKETQTIKFYENKIIDEQDRQRFIDFWEYVNTLNEKDFLFLCLKITTENGVDQESSEYQVGMLRKCIHSTSISDGFLK